MTIKLLVTKDRYGEVVSVDDDMYFMEMTNKQVYDYMLQFVWDEDKKEYFSAEEARKLFKKVKSKELGTYVMQFITAINEAFVNPPKGATSETQ